MRSPRFVGLFVVGASVVLASVASAQIRIRTNPDPVNCQTGNRVRSSIVRLSIERFIRRNAKLRHSRWTAT